MGQALLHGLVASGWAEAAELIVVEVVESARGVLAAANPGLDVRDSPKANIDTLIAVKPHHVLPCLAQLNEPSRLISIAAGITIATIEEALAPGTPVLRVMPNTPSLVGAGASAIAGGSAATSSDVEWATSILDSVGNTVVVPETALDAVTGLSGSGPAYLFLVAEAMIDAGVAAGLTRDVATQLTTQTIYGAGKLLLEGDESPTELRAAVTTPAGTTAAGLRVLEQNGVRAAFIDAVMAAANRAEEMGKQ